MALTSENSKHVKVIRDDFMKMREVVSVDVNQGRFWKAEQLLQRVQHALPFQPPSYLPAGTPASRLPVPSLSAGAAPVPVAAQVTPFCRSTETSIAGERISQTKCLKAASNLHVQLGESQLAAVHEDLCVCHDYD